MPNLVKISFLNELKKKYGNLKKLSNSLSLYELGDSSIRIYIRYSKIHKRNQSFYGLRNEDIKQLDCVNSVICFLWPNQIEPLFIPYSDFEDIFNSLEPASDGQFKLQIYHNQDQLELYIANMGRFNIEGFLGWNILENLIDNNKLIDIPDFSHSQIQTMVGSIGLNKGFDVWIPTNDRKKLDWKITSKYECIRELPGRYDKIKEVLQEVDVMWLKSGSSDLSAIFEVEHSTPIYSGLLRFNDLHLVEPHLKPKFSIVSNYLRKSLFLKQINRPTFRRSGLSDLCNFLEYKEVFNWYNRIIK